MKLIIAEKPNLAKEFLNEFIVPKFNPEVKFGRSFHIFTINDIKYFITWASGHLYTLQEPEEYDPKYKYRKVEDLPLAMPLSYTVVKKVEYIKSKDSQSNRQYKKVLSDNDWALSHLTVIKDLLGKTQEVIHFGDAAREGQLIIDQILHELNYKGKVSRFWVNGNTFKDYDEAWGKLKPNEDYIGYYQSAQTRQWADWYVGMNYSRLVTAKYKELNPDKKLQFDIGRLLTPVLKMIYKRELDIKNFIPKEYYIVKAQVNLEPEICMVPLEIQKDLYSDYLNEDNKIIDRKLIDILHNDIPNGSSLIVSAKEEKETKRFHPKQYKLSRLQADLSKLYGMQLGESKEIIQELYERKLITYPRTDCEYLTDDQFNQVEDKFNLLSQFPSLSSYIIPKKDYFKSDAFNSKKTADFDHFAIHPNIISYDIYSSLSESHKLVFDVIAKRYIQSVYPYKIDKQLNISFTKNNHKFNKTVFQNKSKGWDIYSDINNTDDDEIQEEPALYNALNQLSPNDTVKLEELVESKEKTRPPKYFTSSTLLDALMSVHKYLGEEKIPVNDIEAYKEILKSKCGLGTASTRDEIVLVLERKGYISPINLVTNEKKSKSDEAKKKNKEPEVRTTEEGRTVIDFIEKLGLEELTSPVVTARLEEKLSLIVKGKYSKEEFLSHLLGIINADIDKVKKLNFENKNNPSVF